MKNTTKCPLCGGKPEYIEFGCGDGESDLIQCNCGLCTPAGSYPNGEENCWKDWEKLISKFPPIMRVKVGDKVEVLETGNKSLISEVRQVRVKQGVIAVIGSRRLYNTIDVFRWPWELERKGGEEQ